MLQRSSGEVLIAQRPAGKLAAGKWEFPGGKIEAGESPREALRRELAEELGVWMVEAEPLAVLRQDYSDRRVRLETWRIDRFEGTPSPCEGQRLEWIRLDDLGRFDVLPSCWRVAAALRMPRHYVFTPPLATPQAVLERLPKLPAGALLRLRLPALGEREYAALAAQVVSEGRHHGIRVMLDRAPEQVSRLGAAGWHASAAIAHGLKQRPIAREALFLVSAHEADELACAHAVGADAAVLGPVAMTATHPGQSPLGWSRFAMLCDEAGLPVFALGGVGPNEFSAARASGAMGIAGISAYWS